MAYLKNTDANQIITRFVNFNKTEECNLTVQQALDGTEYMTRFGDPFVYYELTLYVNETGKALLYQAADTLAHLEVSVKQGVFTGRIKDVGKFDLQAAGWYKTTVTLSAENEVNER